MSLARAMVRLITTQALTDRTVAGPAVSDSSLVPVDARATSDNRPEIVVYTDDHESETRGRGALFAESSNCELVIEIVVTGMLPVTVDGQDGGAEERVVIPYVDSGLAFTLDLVERQVLAELAGGSTVWAQLWRDFVPTVHKRLSRQGGSAKDAVRFAARQIVLTVDLLHDPLPGQVLPAESAWLRALDTMDATPELAVLARIIRTQLTEAGSADWRTDAAALGLNLSTMDELGHAPADGGMDMAQLDEVSVEPPTGNDPVAVDQAILPVGGAP